MRTCHGSRHHRICAMRTRQRLIPLAAALAFSIAAAAHAAKVSCASVTAETCATAQRLGRGINMGNMLAARYQDRSPRLLFELLNEPHGRLNGDPWNRLAAQTLAVVRVTNPTRTVLIGPGEWNSIGELPKLRLPPDRNIIVSIHNYDPFPFTHQGVDYMPQYPVGPTCCDAKQRRQITDALDAARRWG